MKIEDLNLKELDKDLSIEQQEEWNAIYASYRSKSVLSGKVAGLDIKHITETDPVTHERKRRPFYYLVVISYRIKVLIPQTEIWYSKDETRPPFVLHSMVGAAIDYVITDIERENDYCIASRREALEKRRRGFARIPPKPGQRIQINTIAVGRVKLLCEYKGYDVTLTPRDLSYAMIPDCRERYHAGEVLNAKFIEYNEEKDEISVSVKDAEPHPFEGANIRHPIGCRRASIITGKYNGGVFCQIEKNLDCLCTYSPLQYDENFQIGDQVIIAIMKFDDSRKMVYGKIIAKW